MIVSNQGSGRRSNKKMNEHLAGEITDWFEFFEALLVRDEVVG